MIKLITAPTEEPVTLAEAQAQCRVDDPADSALLNGLIRAAREQAEHETGRALCTQTRELVADSFATALILRGAPIQSVATVKYLDSAGNEQTLASTEYRVDTDSEPGRVLLGVGKSWPSTYPVPNAVRVRYTCGYGAAASVPQAIKQWILLVVATLYSQRETIAAGQLAALPERMWHRLLDPYCLYEAV